jgi:pimeloyl-ACP methyl ester carboxylesterase
VDRGYAVLLYDKPGVGGSTWAWKRQSFDDRGDEAMAAVRYLAGRGDMDPGRIGLMGHSQGGWIAQLAGARHPDEVGFLILLAGPAISVKQQISDDMENGWACRGLTGPGLALRQGALRSALGVLDLVGRVAHPLYLARIIHFDPVDLLPRVVQPTLALFAENDPLVVPAVNEARLREHLGRAAGGGRLQVATIPGADHFFRSAPWCPGEQRPGGWAPGFFEALATPAFWAWVETEGIEARTSQ